MDTPPFSVLLVDDEPALLEIFSHMAERSREVTMQTAASAKDALRLLQEQRFDAIIADYDMPETNGIELLKTLRSRGDEVPVIIYTGVGSEQAAIDAINNGASFYLKKSKDARMQFRELMAMVKAAADHPAREYGTMQRIIADMVNFASDPMLAIDREGCVLAWNDAMEQLTDVPSSAIAGKGDLVYAEPFFGTKRKMLVDLIFASDDEIRNQQYMLINRVPKGPVIAVTRGEKRDGSAWTLWTKAMPIFDGQGEFVAAVGTVRDVTATFSDVVIRETAGIAMPETAAEGRKPAGRLFDKILCKAPADYRKGVVLMVKEKKYREAIAAFDRALKVNEKFAQGWNDRGVCYRQLNDYTSALKSCLRAVELDSENPELLFTLGTTLEQIGVLYKSTKYLESAVQVFKMVIGQLPNNMDAWNHLGICYKEMGREEEAKFHFDRVRDIRTSRKDTPIVSRRNEYL